jgi:hypothetical protein
MRTFLQLCNDVERESGTVGTGAGLIDVSDPPTPRQRKIVEWTANAWVMIQQARPDWSFLRSDFETLIVQGVDRYDPVEDLDIERFGAWLDVNHGGLTIYSAAAGGKAQESELCKIRFPQWRDSYDRGQPVASRPVVYAISPQQHICFGNTPDATYYVRGQYRMAPQQLVDSADLVEIPSGFESIIVWKAVLLLAQHDEGPVQVATSRSNYADMFASLVRAHTGVWS